jgi:hypothetical protein
MTAPVNDITGQKQGLVHIEFPLPEAQRLESALRWLLPALVDRPTLTDKQRERRLATRTAIDGLLTQLQTRVQADASNQPQVANGIKPRP